MSVTRQEHAGAEGGGEIDLGRLVAAVHDALDSEDTERCFHAWQDMTRQARRMQLDDEQRAMIKAVNRRVDELIDRNHSKRVGELIDRNHSKRVGELIDRNHSKRVGELIDRNHSKRVGEVLNRLADERMERRQKWYREVGIHRDFARDCARRWGSLSC